MRRIMWVAVVVALAAPGAWATGFMVPADRHLAGLHLESHRVNVSIDAQAAVTRVEEVFVNQHDRQLEAVFVFPLPKGAAVNDFKMYVNGKLVTGEIKEAAEARRIYHQIVRQMRDPGLLEYVDSSLLKLSVFPVPPKGRQEVSLVYTQTLKADAGLVEYVYPLKTDRGSAGTLKDFTMNVDIRADAAIKNVYSPTHDIAVRRASDTHVTAGFERSRARLDQNFRIFYALCDAEFGASLVTFRPDGADGYFLLLVSPKIEVAEKDVAPKDVAFVIDVSGSMKGEKIDQARKALEFCVNSLGPGDRFRIITFSNGVDEFEKGFTAATRDNIGRAVDYIRNLKAGGGTDIDSALDRALSGAPKERSYYIVFLTDGRPTVGLTDDVRIIDNVGGKNGASTRIFCFGVGHDVNAALLDELAKATRATNQYVEPGEDIEVKVSGFFAKIGRPLLADVEIDFGAAGAYDVYPTRPGDIFTGSRLTIAGRYRNDAAADITLTGRGAGGDLEFVYPVEFTGSDAEEFSFVRELWAGRKIAFLLEEIRLRGEKTELKNEVISLSKEYGIMTPYTSYLVTEGSPVIADLPVVRRMFREEAAYRHAGPSAQESRMSEIAAGKSAGLKWDRVGTAAVRASAANNELIAAAQVERGNLMRQVADENFSQIRGVWVQQEMPRDLRRVTVKFASEAYFEIFDNAPKATQRAFALGERLILRIGEYILVVDAEGIEEASNDEVQAVIAAAQAL